MKKARVEQIFAKLNEPGVLISYNTEEKHPVECKVTSYACSDCTTEVIANRMSQPFCPSCTGDLKQSSNKVMSFNKNDLKELKPLINCEACATSYITNDETLKALASVGFNCPVCTTAIKASSTMEEDSDESSDDTSDDSDVTDVSEEDSSNEDNNTDTTSEENSSSEEDNSSEENNDEDETDSEIDEVMNNLAPDSDNSTETNENTENNDTETNNEESTEENNSDNTEESSENEENKDKSTVDEAAVTAAFFKAAVSKTKKFDLIHSTDYNHWYLIGDGTTPLAVSAFDEASTEIQPIFRSDSYKNAFESGQQADGGVNPDLLKDFGFTPVEVNVDLDDVTKQHVEDEVAKKTDELNNKIEEIEDITAQCLGIAVMADLKGIYPSPNGIRTPLINELSAVKVRNPEALVDRILSKYMPEYMKSMVTKATELAHKSESALAEQAEMISAAEYRTPVTASDKGKSNNVLPFAVMAETNDGSNQENHNLNSRESVESSARGPNHDLKKVIGSLKRPSSGRR